MKYYIEDINQPNGFVEVTEIEYNEIFGEEIIRPYVVAVYQRDIEINEVPEQYVEMVQTVVLNRIKRWGVYESNESKEV